MKVLNDWTNPRAHHDVLILDERNSIAKLRGVPFATAAALTMPCRAIALCLYVTRKHRER